ncbi:MAG: hypothetical protein LBO74_02375 [Candidatus Symbiothrix sp.]|jgi:hypothetical protein|nr:hypothetical protein [Candidatus Symbiothrix sp.]
MTTKEILQLESTKGEATILLLFREGIFLKAYEESAYLFYRFVKKYQIKTVYYKNIDRALLSLGFPSHSFETLVGETGLDVLGEPENGVYKLTSGTFSFSEEEFRSFKKEYTSPSPVQLTRKKTESAAPQIFFPALENSAETKVIIQLQQFNIASSTPMECMLFLNTLKLALNGQLLYV